MISGSTIRLKSAATTTIGASPSRTAAVEAWKTTSSTRWLRIGASSASAEAVPARPLLTTKKVSAAAPIAGRSAASKWTMPVTCGRSDSSDSTAPAAPKESVYCAMLKAERQAERLRARSVTSEPTTWASAATGAPQQISAAKEKVVEVLISASRRGTSIGRSSPRMTSRKITANSCPAMGSTSAISGMSVMSAASPTRETTAR